MRFHKETLDEKKERLKQKKKSFAFFPVENYEGYEGDYIWLEKVEYWQEWDAFCGFIIRHRPIDKRK